MSATRSFAHYGQTAPVQIRPWLDPKKTIQQDAAGPFGYTFNLLDVDGNAAASGWFQMFDLAAAPTTGVTVPLKSFQVTAAGPLPSIFQQIGPIEFFNGCWFAMSSTETVYTAVGTAFDVFGEVDEWEGQQIAPTNTAGSLVNTVDLLAVWSDNQGSPAPRKLLQVDVINGTGVQCYLQLFALTLPVSGVSIPIRQWNLGTGSAQQTFRFGPNGIIPTSLDSDAVTIRRGCSLAVSTTVGLYTRNSPNNLNSIRAYSTTVLT